MAVEYLVIDGWESETDAWRVMDYTPLKEPAAQRGGDRLIPGLPGVRAHRRRNTVTVKQIPMQITGVVDSDGDPFADGLNGLQQNIDEIIDSIVEPVASATGTRSATWHLPDGSTRTAQIHVTGLQLQRVSPVEARAVLTISIPAGRFQGAS